MATQQSTPVTPVATQQLTPTPVTTMFQGYDTFMNSAMDTAVEGGTNSPGANATSNYSVCTNYTQVQRALSISASDNGGYIICERRRSKL